jgi:hypothetical protein
MMAPGGIRPQVRTAARTVAICILSLCMFQIVLLREGTDTSQGKGQMYVTAAAQGGGLV